MTVLFLRAASEAEMLAALTAAALIDADGAPLSAITIDIIGQDPARVIGHDEQGEPILSVMPGYHLNLYGDVSDEAVAALAGVTIDPPANPYRVRFGA